MALQFTLRTSRTGAMLSDYTALTEEAEFGTNEHGFAHFSAKVPVSAIEAFWLYDRAMVPHVTLSDNGQLVYEGRLEDVSVKMGATDALSLRALGYYRALSDNPHTATYAAVPASTIVAALLPLAPALKQSTLLVQNPGVNLDEEYESEYPADILELLNMKGDSQTPPRVWVARVYEGGYLEFAPRGTDERHLYAEVSEFEVNRTIEMLWNAAYANYKSTSDQMAVTATATDAESISLWNLTRTYALAAETSNATNAARMRDTWIEDHRNPPARAGIEVAELFDEWGARYPKWEARAGDKLTVRNLRSTLTVDVDRLRTFRIKDTNYKINTDHLSVTPDNSKSTVERLLAEAATSSRSVARQVKQLRNQIGPGGTGVPPGHTTIPPGSAYIIPGAIIAFNLTACPAGWTQVAAGQVIVGLTVGGTLGGSVGTPLTDLQTRAITTVVAHTHGPGTLATSDPGGHTHGPGTLALDSQGSHTHAPGTLGSDTSATHTHGVGTYAAAGEAAHTHSAATVNVVSEAVHTHPVNPPSTTSGTGGFHIHNAWVTGAESGLPQKFLVSGAGTKQQDGDFVTGDGSHTHALDIASFTSGAGASHDHTLTGSTDAGTSHTHGLSGSSASGGSHSHAITTGVTASAGGHTHTLSGASASAGGHTHALSGSTASVGSASVDVTMPYKQYIYCQKD